MNKKIKIYIFSPFSFIGGDTLSISRLIKNLNPMFSNKKFEVGSGDTFQKIVDKMQISKKEKENVLIQLSKFKGIK